MCLMLPSRSLQSFQNMIKQRPFDKDKVILKIEANMKWWEKLFQSPPPEIKRLLDGFRALKEALTINPQSLDALKRVLVNDKATAIKGAQDTVVASYASMMEITVCLEEQIESRELRMSCVA